MTNKSVFKIKPGSDYVYQQYRSIKEIEDFFGLVDEIIEEFYFGETLSNMWDCRNISNTNSEYMYFYSRYYLGLIRPVRINPNDHSSETPSDATINRYDTAMLWDSRFIYDDYSLIDPEMPMSMFIAMIGFVYNYSEETWTHDLMMRYAAAMCNMSPNDVHLSFENDKVIYWLLNSQQCRAFITYMAQDEYKLNFPFAKCYEFRLGDHKSNTNNTDEFILGYMRPDTWQQLPKNEIPSSADF